MNKPINAAASVILLFSSASIAAEETRLLVRLPEMMQQHMMSNMRDHLVAIYEILINMANSEPENAAEVAESRLGMSSLESHGASHMAKFMPVGMRQAGTSMHRAASRFALKPKKEKHCQLTKCFRRSHLPVSPVIQVIVFGDTGVA